MEAVTKKLGILVLTFGTCLAGFIPLQPPSFYSAPVHNQYYQPPILPHPIPHVLSYHYNIFQSNPAFRGTHVIYPNSAPTAYYNYHGPLALQPPVYNYPIIPFNPYNPGSHTPQLIPEVLNPELPPNYAPINPEEQNPQSPESIPEPEQAENTPENSNTDNIETLDNVAPEKDIYNYSPMYTPEDDSIIIESAEQR